MTGNDQPIAVALDDATVAFRVAGDRVYTAVQQASLSVADGEFVAIVGPTMATNSPCATDRLACSTAV